MPGNVQGVNKVDAKKRRWVFWNFLESRHTAGGREWFYEHQVPLPGTYIGDIALMDKAWVAGAHPAQPRRR